MLEEFEEVVTSAPLEEEQEEPAVEEEEEEAVPRPYPVHDVRMGEGGSCVRGGCSSFLGSVCYSLLSEYVL